MVNCTELAQYVKEGCGHRWYNWSLHKEYLANCVPKGTFIECQSMLGIEGLEKLIPYMPFILFIALVCIFMPLSIYIILSARRSGS